MLAPDTSTTGLILLKDGSVIIPQSGFTPKRVSAGGKFLFSFEPISTTRKVSNVHVTSFQLAIDSLFVPALTDSVAFKAALHGRHACVLTYASAGYSNPLDTTKLVLKNFNISVNGNVFECDASSGPVPGGNGTLSFTGAQRNNLNFVNNTFPGLPYLLRGNYYYALLDNYIAVWTYDNKNYYSVYMIKR